MYYLIWALLMMGIMAAPGEVARDSSETEAVSEAGCCDPPPPCPPDCGDAGVEADDAT